MLAKMLRFPKLTVSKSQFTKISRFFSESDDGEEPDLNEGQDERNAIIQKGFKYKFNNKTISFVLDSPLFVYKSKSIHVGKKKVEILKSLSLTSENIFATAILPKDLDRPFPTNETNIENNTYIDLSNDHQKKSQNALEYYHSVGSYCVVDLLDETHISLRCLHKAKVHKLTQIHLHEQGNLEHDDLQGFYANKNDQTSIIIETEKDEKIPEHESDQTSKKKENTQILKQRSQKVNIPENILHLSEIERHVYPHYNSLGIETRVKVDYLVDMNKKILPQRFSDGIFVINYHDLETFLDGIGTLLSDTSFFKYEEMTSLFAAESIDHAIDLSLQYIKRYLIFINKMTDIGKIADQNLQLRKNKEYYNEVYNIIKRFAEADKKSPLKILEETFSEKKAPAHVKEIFDENLKKLQSLDKNHSEYAVIKNYLDVLANLPFGIYSQDNFDLDRAKAVLDKSHYGLEDVKKRILEFLAVGKLSGGVKGKILCLQGPPGVGKTSFAFSVAEALERKVYRISMGGESDISVLKGHRKTYIGSKPGKIIAGLKECQTENCVIIIDEIDKIGKNNYIGDPQSTLLEILDPEQNNTFVDNYMDFPIDLSNVFFICTANNLSTISAPLLDRMDVVSISSYTNLDKERIFKNFLMTQTMKENGILAYCDQFEIKDEIIEKLINSYCRDPGIRSLQKYSSRLIEKLAYDILMKEEKNEENPTDDISSDKIVIDSSNLYKYIGQPIYEKDNMYEKMVPGVIKGLAYSEVGGSVLFIEASLGSIKKYTKGLKVTGNLGDVMKESIKIAYSFSRHFLMGMKNNFLEEYLVHVHVPEGATPKDGPSAGIAITSGLISLSMNRPLDKKFAMTGEISLKGKVLKIGGLKEKILAAKREKVTDIIVPKENKEDVEYMTQDVKGDIQFHFVEFYQEVFNLLFGEKNNS